MRWDYYGVVKEKNNLFANFIVSSFDPVADIGTGPDAVGTPGLSQLYEPDYKNFSPRASIAWDVTGKGKTVVRVGGGLFYDAFSQDMFLGHLPYPASMPRVRPTGTLAPPRLLASALARLGTIIAGVPVYGAVGLHASSECDIFAVDRHIKTPYMENYNLNIQQQLTSKTTLQIGYVGSQGHRLFRFHDINQPSQASSPRATLLQPALPRCATHRNVIAAISTCRDPSVHRPSAGMTRRARSTSSRRSRPASRTTTRCRSAYKVNGWHGITSARQLRRIRNRWITPVTSKTSFSTLPSRRTATTRSAEYGPSNFNIPHRFTWVFSYELPKMGGACSAEEWLGFR